MKKFLTSLGVALALSAAALGQQQGASGGQSSSANGQQAAAAAAGGPILSPGPSAARFPKNSEEFDQLFNQVKNWGRWGQDDQLGAANLITEAKRKQALGLAKSGLVVSLAHPPLKEMAPDNPQPFNHTMNRGFSTDTYSVSYHGYAHSHIDALCHITYKGQTYNGHQATEIQTEKGCTKLSIDNLKNGVITRGVLLDIPRLKNLPYLEPGTPVFTEDIEAWEKKANVKVQPGDAIFLRTGRWARREKLGPWAIAVAEGARRLVHRQRRCAGRHAVARRGSDAAGPHAGDHGDGNRHPRQPGSREGRRDRGAAEPLGIPADGVSGSGHGRDRLPRQCTSDLLTSRRNAENAEEFCKDVFASAARSAFLVQSG
jgi:Putative cyclase